MPKQFDEREIKKVRARWVHDITKSYEEGFKVMLPFYL
jgi:hypothetical protein